MCIMLEWQLEDDYCIYSIGATAYLRLKSLFDGAWISIPGKLLTLKLGVRSTICLERRSSHVVKMSEIIWLN